MRAYGVRGAHWEAKIVFFKIKWFFGMTRCHACLRNSVLYPKMRLGRHMYQCWVLAAKPRFRWHAVDFSASLDTCLTYSCAVVFTLITLSTPARVQ